MKRSLPTSKVLIAGGIVTTVLLLFFPALAQADDRLIVTFDRIDGQRMEEEENNAMVVSGVVPLELVVKNSRREPVGGTLRLQIMVDKVPLEPILEAPPYIFNWDTSKTPEGTHALWAKILESPGNNYASLPIVVVVDNVPGPVTGPQNLPSCPYWQALTSLHSGWPYTDTPPCDWVYYSGSPPNLKGHPQPVVPGIPFNTRLPSSELFGEKILPLISLFAKTPKFFQVPGGHVVALPFNTIAGSDYHAAAKVVDQLPLMDGPRNVGYLTAYSVGVVHPVTEELIFAETGEKRGRVGKVSLDGTVTTLAGYRTKANVLPYPRDDERSGIPSISDALRQEQYELIGNFLDGPVGFKLPSDVAVDPRNLNIVYVADAGNNRIVRMDMTTNPVTLTTYAGSLTGEIGLRDGLATAALFSEPFSITMSSDGTLYVADRHNSLIRKIAPDRTVTTVVGNGPLAPVIPPISEIRNNPYETNRGLYMVNGDFEQASIVYPMVIRLDSKGNLIMAEELLATIRRIDLVANTVELVRLAPSNNEWVWLDVDREGTFGPKDDILFVAAASVEDVFRISSDGSVVQGLFGGSYDFAGRLNTIRSGHYPWMATVGKGALWTNGFGTDGLIRVRKARPEDRVDNSNELVNYYERGEVIYMRGTALDFPWGARPSFSMVNGRHGWSQLGVSPNFDDLVSLSDQELATLIQSGWGGSVPRPEITGKDLRDLIYFVRRSALLESPLTPGPDPTETTPPIISGVAVAELAGSRVRVSWNTNEPTVGVVEFGASSGNYHRFSEIENSYGISHAVDLGPLVPAKVYQFTVRVRDTSGNPASAEDATFSIIGMTDSTPPAPPTGLVVQ